MAAETQQTTLPTGVTKIPEGACVNYDNCGNFPPGHPNTNNQMCDDCLDAARARGRGHDL
ncbi:hypothetical protein [Haloferax larsenii]|uniref:Uncharacterized protein n=1 Tax=Haloferax larsenii TaxID=302484 RepID=A0A1H7N7S7_HALLR|nr:hypothetical protein [Haloferax larsenii]SEL19018.1 hypothetical protein SAMN04488691_103204 [Haloferax larsenii]